MVFRSWKGKSRQSWQEPWGEAFYSLEGSCSHAAWNVGSRDVICLHGKKKCFCACTSGFCYSRIVLLEVSHSTMLFSNRKRGKTPKTFFGWLYLPISNWNICRHTSSELFWTFCPWYTKKPILWWYDWHIKRDTYLMYKFGNNDTRVKPPLPYHHECHEPITSRKFLCPILILSW